MDYSKYCIGSVGFVALFYNDLESNLDQYRFYSSITDFYRYLLDNGRTMDIEPGSIDLYDLYIRYKASKRDDLINNVLNEIQ